MLYFAQRGEARRYSYVFVLGVFSVGEGRARSGHNDAGLFTKGYCACSATLQQIQRDEVAALWVCPAGCTGTAQVVLKGAQNRLELGAQQLGVLGHVGFNRGDIRQELNMS